jgi:hypothetical protein
VKHAMQRGIWIPTQHLLWDQGKSRKTLIELQDLLNANRLLVSSPTLDTRVLTLVPIFAVVFFSIFLFPHKLFFLQIVLCACNLDKHQTMYSTYCLL